MGIRLNKFIATAGGIGYLPLAPGTWAALVFAAIWFFINKIFPGVYSWQIILILLFVFGGVYCSGKILNDREKDPNYIVIDEVAGMFLTLIFIPPTLLNILAGFLLFRFFDIVKPFGIRKMEKLKKGWGIMFDDVLAGIYSTIVLRLLIVMKLW